MSSTKRRTGDNIDVEDHSSTNRYTIGMATMETVKIKMGWTESK